MAKKLMKGNEALAAAAIAAGATHFFGYPITPQSELIEYMAREMPKAGGCFLQAESEVAASYMVYGAGGAGARVITSTSSPGLALKQEGLTYMVAAQIPAVVINVSRGGPGLGNILPQQSDYFMCTRGGGNGDYYHPCFAPASVQECADLVTEAFDIADKYRMPVLILADGLIGQMMEPVEIKEATEKPIDKPWAADGGHVKRGEHNRINAMILPADGLEELNHVIQAKLKDYSENYVRYEAIDVEDADIVLVAYGTPSRACKNVLKKAKEEGLKFGLIRPISLYPFPKEAFDKINPNCKAIISVEQSCGQMIEDIRLSVLGKFPIKFFGRTGGNPIIPDAVYSYAKEVLGGKA